MSPVDDIIKHVLRRCRAKTCRQGKHPLTGFVISGDTLSILPASDSASRTGFTAYLAAAMRCLHGEVSIVAHATPTLLLCITVVGLRTTGVCYVIRRYPSGRTRLGPPILIESPNATFTNLLYGNNGAN